MVTYLPNDLRRGSPGWKTNCIRRKEGSPTERSREGLKLVTVTCGHRWERGSPGRVLSEDKEPLLLSQQRKKEKKLIEIVIFQQRLCPSHPGSSVCSVNPRKYGRTDTSQGNRSVQSLNEREVRYEETLRNVRGCHSSQPLEPQQDIPILSHAPHHPHTCPPGNKGTAVSV